MSKENDKQSFIDEPSSSRTEEKIIILSLVDEISTLEEKITELKQSISNNNFNDKNKEIEILKKTKNKLNKEINQLSVNLLLNLSNKENFIKKKSYIIKDITKKINNYKNILSTYNILSFSSPILKKYISSNKMNHFLSDEQIDDIMSKTQTIYNNENLIQKYEKEFAVNKEELSNNENDKKKILQKINEIKENLKMMKEEKITIKNELVNYISLKETLESIIKVNLPSLLTMNKEENNEDEVKSNSKNYRKNSFISGKEINSQNRENTINSITEEDNENEKNNSAYLDISLLNLNSNNINIANLGQKNWDEIINLYKYEFFYLDTNKISIGISDEIFDTISTKMINDNNNPINMNNLGNSLVLDNKKSSNITKSLFGKMKVPNINNNRYEKKNPLIFSCESPIIKKTKTNLFLFNDINDCKKEVQVELKNSIQNFINDFNNCKVSIENFIDKTAEMLIGKLKEYGHFLNKKNLMIYLSFYFKKNFYECMISLKLKFINKDYKNMKKNKKKKIENLQDQLTKLNTKTETIKNTIILQENKLKLLNKIENQDNKKIKNNNDINNIGNLKLSLDEQNYIQLCRKANSFINEKNEIEREIEENENDKKLNKYQEEIKINGIKNDINDITVQINVLENESFNKKAKADEEIAKCRKLIMEKFKKIKELLVKYKSICIKKNDMNIYNQFIDNISNIIDNKYYKSLLDLEKINLNIRNTTPYQNKYKNKELRTNINNSEIDNENINYTTRSNLKSHRRTSSDINKPISFREDHFSIVNSFNPNNYIMNKDNKINNECNSTSRKNYKNNDNKKRIEGNNYINVFDSCNNLNNYYFQFQSPSTLISIDANKKLNNYILNNKNRQNKNPINITSYSTLFNSNSKLNSNKKCSSPKKNIKPKNLINNLKYCLSDKKNVMSSNYKMKTINVEDFNINQKNIKNLYISKQKNINNNQNSNHLKSYYNKDNNYIIIDNKSNSHINFLYKRTFCYYRLLNHNDNNNKFNPLENVNISQLCKSPYNYIKSTLNFDKKEDILKIFPSNQLESINIKIEKIEKFYISSKMKIVIDIYKGFQKLNYTFSDENINKYIKKIKKGNILYSHFKDEEIKKICNNKYFVFSISVKNMNKFEFLFCSYEEFKLWNNAICFFIKNNTDFFSNFTYRNKFEYP